MRLRSGLELRLGVQQLDDGLFIWFVFFWLVAEDAVVLEVLVNLKVQRRLPYLVLCLFEKGVGARDAMCTHWH